MPTTDNLHVRFAHVEDVDAIQTVMSSHDVFMGVKDLEQKEILRLYQRANLLSMLSPPTGSFNVRAKIVLCYDDDTLVGVNVTRTSDQQACFYLVRSHTLKGINSGPQVLSCLLAATINYYKNLGYQRFYTVYRAQHLKAYQRLWRANKVLDGWSSWTELRLPANTKPQQFEFWDRLYGRMLVPEDTLVRCFVHPMDDVTLR
jgi:hypothetical protein